MSQDELAIKFVLDPTQFREELGRLRRDLEDQYRIDTDKSREERREEDGYPPQLPTGVEIREKVVGLDEDTTKRIDDIAGDVEQLKRGLGLPIPIGDQTIGGLRDLFQRALTELPGYAGMHRQDIQDVTDMLAVMEDRFGGGTGIGQLKEEGYTPMVAVMRKLSDLLYYVGQASDTDRTLGIYSSIGNTIESFFRGVVQQFPGIPVGDLPGVESKMSLGHAGLEELFSILTEQEAVGKLGMREFRFKNEDEKLEGIIDFFARFQHESGMTGARGIEIATTKAGEPKMDQLRRYIESTMRYIQREAGEEGSLSTFLKKLARDPEKYEGLARVTTVFTTAVQDFDKKLLETLEKGVGGEEWEDVLGTILEVETLQVPKEMQLETAMKDIAGMRPEEMRKHRAINMLSWLKNDPEIFQKFVRAVNPLNIPIEEFAEKLQTVIDTYQEELRESGQPVSLDDVMKGVTTRAKDLARESSAARYEERGALRILGKYRERGVSGVPYGIGRGLKTAYTGLGEEIFTEYSTEAEREQVSRLVGITPPEQETRAEVEEVEERPSISSGRRAELVEEKHNHLADIASLEQHFREGTAQIDSQEELDERTQPIREAIFAINAELGRGGVRREEPDVPDAATAGGVRSSRFVTTGVPMEYDPKEYLVGMKKVAKEMGFKGAEGWDEFVGLIEAKGKGELGEHLKEKVGSVMTIVGATMKDIAASGVLSEEQEKSLMDMMGKTPRLGRVFKEFTPSMDESGSPDAIDSDKFRKLIRERITVDDLPHIKKELDKILRNPEINAMLSPENLTGLHHAAIAIKRAERATMDLEPAFGGALDYWT